MEARRPISPAQRRRRARWGVTVLILLLSALSASGVQTARDVGAALHMQVSISTYVHAITRLQSAATLLTQTPLGAYSPGSRVATDALAALRLDLAAVPRSHLSASLRFHLRRAVALVRDIARPPLDGHIALYMQRQQNELLTEINTINAQLRQFVAQTQGSLNRTIRNARWWGSAFAVTLVITLVVFLLRVLAQAAAQRHTVNNLALELQRDPLTGWANRALFIDAMDRGLAQASRAQRHAGTLFLDLDRFKIINDRFGHAAGDQVLRQITHRFAAVIRSGDLPARVGGDELAVFMPDLPDDAAAAQLARRLMECLNDPLMLNGVPVSVGLSIGIAIFPANGLSAAELLNAADQAMYRAKQQGGGYVYHTAAVTTQVARQQQMAKDLYLAVREDQLFCLFQPIFDAKTCYPVAVEALVRWRHPNLGVVAPADWLPLAQRAELLAGFTSTILEHALKELPAWKKLGWSPRVSINLSATECLNPQLPVIIADLLRKFSLKGSDIDLDITDELLAMPIAIDAITQLKKLGVGLTMDGTGGGYPSFSSMHRLPLNCVKVDRTVIDQLTRSTRELELFAAFVALTHRVRLQVIAEGVETEAQASAALAAECDLLQGHYYAPAQEAELLLRHIQQLTSRGQPTSTGGWT